MPVYIIPLIVTLAIQTQVSLVVFTPPILAPQAQFDIGVEAAAVGMVTSLIYLSSVLATLLSSQILNKMGAIRVSQLCILLTSLGMLLMTIPNYFLIGVGAIIIGFGYGPITPASSMILANSVPQNLRGLIFSIKQSGVPLGGAAAGLLVPGLLVAFGWQKAAVIVACMGIVLMASSNFFQKVIDTEKPKFDSADEGDIFAPLKLIFGNKRLKELALSSGIYSGMQMSLGTFLVVLLTDSAELSITVAGGALSAAMFGGAFGRLFWGYVSDNFLSPRFVLGILGLIMSISAFTVSLVSPSWPLILVYGLAIIYGASAAGWNGVYLAEVANIVKPQTVAVATGGSLTVTYSGVVIIPILFWSAYMMTSSYAYPFVMLGVLSLVPGLLFFKNNLSS